MRDSDPQQVGRLRVPSRSYEAYDVSFTENELHAMRKSMQQNRVESSVVGDHVVEKLFLRKEESNWVIEFRRVLREARGEPLKPHVVIKLTEFELTKMLTVLDKYAMRKRCVSGGRGSAGDRGAISKF